MKVGQHVRTGSSVMGKPREGEVLEVRGGNAGPPFVVRWLDTRQITVEMPDGDLMAVHEQRQTQASTRSGNRCG